MTHPSFSIKITLPGPVPFAWVEYASLSQAPNGGIVASEVKLTTRRSEAALLSREDAIQVGSAVCELLGLAAEVEGGRA